EVLEDGVPQQILTFERHAPGVPASASATATPLPGVPGSPPARLSVIAMAWDQLSPEGRALAAKAAKTLVEKREAGELLGVFLVDRALQTLQPYTTDGQALQAAVDRVAMAATTE